MALYYSTEPLESAGLLLFMTGSLCFMGLSTVCLLSAVITADPLLFFSGLCVIRGHSERKKSCCALILISSSK